MIKCRRSQSSGGKPAFLTWEILALNRWLQLESHSKRNQQFDLITLEVGKAGLPPLFLSLDSSVRSLRAHPPVAGMPKIFFS